MTDAEPVQNGQQYNRIYTRDTCFSICKIMFTLIVFMPSCISNQKSLRPSRKGPGPDCCCCCYLPLIISTPVPMMVILMVMA